jgi:gluconokinase
MAKPPAAPPLVVVAMGVAGSGKSTIGKALADRLGWQFKEGDELHSQASIAKMSAGQPLSDADRAPWLAAIGRSMDGWIAAGQGGVITCSALKRAYRAELTQGRPRVRLVYIRVPRALLAERLTDRKGHFFGPGLLGSQLADLQEPDDAEGVIIDDGTLPPDEQVDEIVRKLKLG